MPEKRKILTDYRNLMLVISPKYLTIVRKKFQMFNILTNLTKQQYTRKLGEINKK